MTKREIWMASVAMGIIALVTVVLFTIAIKQDRSLAALNACLSTHERGAMGNQLPFYRQCPHELDAVRFWFKL